MRRHRAGFLHPKRVTPELVPCYLGVWQGRRVCLLPVYQACPSSLGDSCVGYDPQLATSRNYRLFDSGVPYWYVVLGFPYQASRRSNYTPLIPRDCFRLTRLMEQRSMRLSVHPSCTNWFPLGFRLPCLYTSDVRKDICSEIACSACHDGLAGLLPSSSY